MIRNAEHRDIPAIADLLCQIQNIHAGGRPDIFKKGSRKYSDAQLEEILRDPKRPVYVYEDSGKILGYAFCITEETKETPGLAARKNLYLDDLCVDEKCRGRKIGTELYRYVLEKARELSCDSVTLNVWELNGDACEFYRKMGMVPLKTTMEQRLD